MINPLNWFKKKENVDFEFVDTSRVVNDYYPPILAKHYKPLQKTQKEQFNEYKFIMCPGMFDYSQMGYIIPAWEDIKIKANKAGTAALIGGERAIEQPTKLTAVKPIEMNPELTSGLFEFDEGIQPKTLLFPSPWKVISSNKLLSAYIFGATFHNPKLNDGNLFVYPGIVDFNNGKHKFHTVNFVVSIRKKTEIIIKQGEPLLHVIPFISNDPIVASHRPGKDHEAESLTHVKHQTSWNFYRKHYMRKKIFKLVSK